MAHAVKDPGSLGYARDDTKQNQQQSQNQQKEKGASLGLGGSVMLYGVGAQASGGGF
jgi:hypothetical protein